MDIRLEYDKAKAVKWLMAPGLIGISAEDIAAAHGERNMREIARCMQCFAFIETLIHFIFIFQPLSPFCRKAEERAASRTVRDTAPSAVKVASAVCRVAAALLSICHYFACNIFTSR